MAGRDPWALDLTSGKQQSSELKGGGGIGVPCPKKNWGQPCPVCDKAARLFATGTEENNVLGRKIYAKKQAFCNVEFLNERGKTYLMLLPVSAAQTLLEGIYETQAFGAVTHPAPKEGDNSSGLPLILSKRKEKEYVKYSITPKMAATIQERRVSSANILKMAYSFQDIVHDVVDGKVENIFNPRSDLAIGNSVAFKLLPNKDDPSKSPIHIGYFHYNVEPSEVQSSGKTTSPSSTEGTTVGRDTEFSNLDDFESVLDTPATSAGAPTSGLKEDSIVKDLDSDFNFEEEFK